MKIEKFTPSFALTPFIREFMIIESELGTSNKIIPDTTLVMAFRYRGTVKKMDGEKKEAIASSVITGLRRSANHFVYSKKTANVLVVFKEGGIAAFSRIPAHEFFGQSIPAENLFPSAELNEISERLAEAKTSKSRIDSIDAFLLKKLVASRPDPLIGNAIQLIRQHNGIIGIKDLAASLYLSQDPFEKRFRARVGASPKQYASIIRLRTLIRNYPSYTSLTEASYEAGYFDQSHFIKDFRLFTGQAPKDFFQSPQHW
ncbi:MAG TPA: helix-turn-helix transcriptional regulator [Puia sp.]|nr:helix-turn-helix transcriptional regulator [Puia sp.]